MRTKLIILAWMYLVSSLVFANGVSSGTSIPLPAEIYGGSQALDRWIQDHKLELPSHVEKFSHSSGGEVVVVYHRAGSGMPLLDVYVYACSKANCTILAIRRHILVNLKLKKPIEARLAPDESEFILTTNDGVTQLRFSLKSLAKQ